MNDPIPFEEAAALNLGFLRRYLRSNGWYPREGIRAGTIPDTAASRLMFMRDRTPSASIELYASKSADLDGVELVVPTTTTSPEYAQQIMRVVQNLASAEGRTAADVFRAVREVGFDVVRSRIPDLNVLNDTIHLAVARSFVSEIRSVLASTAMGELSPLPYFLRVRKEAAEYADRCRFAHTFRGSFGFTIESPLDPPTQETLPGFPPPLPFERRVMRRLVRGLRAANLAAERSSLDPIVRDVDTGLNANALEHLVRLVEETSGSALTFEFAFSPEWEPEAGFAGREAFTLGLGPPQLEVVKAAAKELRSVVTTSQETVFGRVIRLASEVDPSDLTDMLGEREVVIQWSSEDLGDIAVRVALSPADYLSALEAHAAGRPVEVSGTLERRPRRWVLVNPVNFAAGP